MAAVMFAVVAAWLCGCVAVTASAVACCCRPRVLSLQISCRPVGELQPIWGAGGGQGRREGVLQEGRLEGRVEHSWGAQGGSSCRGRQGRQKGEVLLSPFF